MTDSTSNCVFCRILEGRLPGSFVYEDDLVAAFMDIHPVNPGHLLIVPRCHESEFARVPSSVAGRMFQVAQKLRRAMQKTDGLRVEGANIFLSDGEVAGQEVPHAHLHLVPRFRGDRHLMGFSETDADAGVRSKLDEMAIHIREQLFAPRAEAHHRGIDYSAVGADDVESWSSLRERLWPGSGAETAKSIMRPDLGVFIARSGERAVAFGEVSERSFANGCDSSPVGFLEGIYVEPEFRRLGIGRELIKLATAWAAKRGLRELASDAELANVDSRRAHESWGFECTEQVQYFRFTIPATFSLHRP